ncbi:GNAT family N-acetyltransferase [Rhizobium alvei]|uniref:GNAT family N-acetyltransferase n=1 Tax=Rhizobium alvei TaxID=1132659 RepID=A0ABT8YNI9_9HYPH|nr:GNAT family N-acetyltransferase [Rhizobium alvei]MDO6964837.1 GNAT family N-acetyltransferase [Rhizobium alvei]
MKINIRDAAATDVATITAIYRESVLNGVGTYELDPPDEAEMAKRFASITGQNFPYLIAENDQGVVMGYAYASPFRTRPAYRYLAEDSIYVAPDARGMNVGGQLLDALLSRSAALGLRQMVAVIGGPNPASVALHEKAGFKHCGRMPATGLKFGQWLDTVIMQIELGEGASTIPSAEPDLKGY